MNNMSKFKVILVWSTFVAVAAIFLTILIIRINDTKSLDSYEDIKSNKLLIKDVLNGKGDEYYVFIYSSENNYDTLKQMDLEPVIMRYFTYVHNNKKTNPDIVPIYGFDINAYQPTQDYKKCADYLGSLSTNITINEVPMLVLVSEGNVSSVYKSLGGSNGIESVITKAMNPETTE